jgi:hypothetical protein
VQWIPSHLTQAEFEAKGFPVHAWKGNHDADEAAKARTHCGRVSDAMVVRVLEQQSRAAEVAQVVASIQLSRLQQRIAASDSH